MATKLFDLTGKVAIVTGGNGGIGLGMARGLAEAGADIAVVGRNAAKSKAAAARAGRRSACKAIAVDGRRHRRGVDAQAMVARVAKQLGRIDILVNNAGINIRKPPQALELEEWDERDQDQPHQRVPVLAGGLPRDEGGGRRQDHQHRLDDVDLRRRFAPAYAASKGGIVQFTRACAVAWATDNIQVNAILPGWIDTDLTQARPRRDRRAARQGAGAHAGGALGRRRRLRGHRGVSGGSSASDFVTGTAIPVDGGFSIMG